MIRYIVIFVAGGITAIAGCVFVGCLLENHPDVSPGELAYLPTTANGRRITVTGRASGVRYDSQGHVASFMIVGPSGGYVSFKDIPGMGRVKEGQLTRVAGVAHIIAGVSPYEPADRIRQCRVVAVD